MGRKIRCERMMEKKRENRKKRELNIRLCSRVRNGFFIESRQFCHCPILNPNWNRIHFEGIQGRDSIARRGRSIRNKSAASGRFSMANDGTQTEEGIRSFIEKHSFRNWDTRTFTLPHNIRAARGKISKTLRARCIFVALSVFTWILRRYETWRNWSTIFNTRYSQLLFGCLID